MGLLLCLALATALPAGVLLVPEPAPEWKVSQWINDDPGTLADNRGKVVLIHFFQLWCPGCHEFSIPLFHQFNNLRIFSANTRRLKGLYNISAISTR